ncbi:AraC family transcriptional regulator [Cohnella silvisoli]|uniref:AraC family transcriptional regulator n=1 Tax=Cohnella silvisoli TaxID=2873699 RepID=A0ABV1KL42_9BACL|nr:AraC family transcriptional regulator [Cohnella silvisoli]MCD9020826.1 AraC family transcriptional regulator [Cohnella silvisoli]
MNRPIETYKGEIYFLNDLLLYVNRATEDFTAPMHNHDFIEFAFIAEGNGFHHIGDEVHEVRKGQLFYIPIGISHVFRPVSTDLAKHPLIVYNCVFSPRLLTKLGEFASDSNIREYIASLIDGSESYFYLLDASDSIEKLFLLLHREYALPREGSFDYLYTLLLQLLIVVHRMKEDPQSPPARKLTHFDHLLTYMEQNLSSELTLSHLSEISRWSERHLQRLFKQHTAQSFNRYLQSLRIQKSCELLRSTAYKISTVAEMAGYKDIASFIAVFKRNVGNTPSGYRKAASQLS